MISNGDDDDDGGAEEGALAGILTVVFLGAITIGIMIYYRFHRRFKRMKTELAHVHYIADPASSQPGKLIYRYYSLWRPCDEIRAVSLDSKEPYVCISLLAKHLASQVVG